MSRPKGSKNKKTLEKEKLLAALQIPSNESNVLTTEELLKTSLNPAPLEGTVETVSAEISGE